jgi:hypothetical protein
VVDDKTTTIEVVCRALVGYPALLNVFDRLIVALTTRSDIAIAVSGSLAAGQLDKWSDLDLEVIALPGADLCELTTWTDSVVQKIAPLWSRFSASHIGLDQLLVFFFWETNTIVKADLHVIELDAFLHLKNTRLLVDPDGLVASRRRAIPVDDQDRYLPDFRDLHAKFCGWIWYTFGKIARGELFEALNSIEVMRTSALLPFLQIVEGLPFEGCRHLETRLTEAHRFRLEATVARSLEPPELRRALLAMAHFFSDLQPQVIARLGSDYRSANLQSMIREVEKCGLNT